MARLTNKEIDNLKNKLIGKDLEYVAYIDARIHDYLQSDKKSRVKNWIDCKTAIDLQRIMLGLYTSKVEENVNSEITVNVVNYSQGINLKKKKK